MQKLTLVSCLLGALSMAATVGAQEPPEMPPPVKEHQWLEQLVGQWDAEIEASMGPDQPPMKCKATQSSRMLGGRWLISDSTGEMMGMKVSSVLTLGYDPEKSKYVGTFMSSCENHLWTYEGKVDEEGKSLTLETEGPNMMLAGKMVKYRETITVKDKDHYEFTSAMQGDDGKWLKFMTANYTRKK